jgi:hypothetical protein
MSAGKPARPPAQSAFSAQVTDWRATGYNKDSEGPSAAGLAQAGPDALQMPRTSLFAPCRSARGILSKGSHLLSMSRVAPCVPAAWHTLAASPICYRLLHEDTALAG